jgi:NitT/TauT family transport system substrate-binding protein
MGIQVSPAMALVMIAQDEAMFDQEGLDVEIKEFTAGKFALQSFFSGAVDFAVSGEVPVALATLQGNQTRVVTQVVERTVNEVRLVALRDRSAGDPRKYFLGTKRKLATSFGGGPEFFTYAFLQKNGIPPADVTIISQKPEDMPAALATGSVDAIAVFDPFAFIAEKQVGSRGITFADQSLYSELYVLNARPEQVERNPEVITALIRALLHAADLAAADPRKARDIVQRHTKLDPAVIDGIWGNFVFKPALTRELLAYWGQEATWAKAGGKLTPATPIPDFRKIIEPRFLQALAPGSVHMDGAVARE